MSGLLSRSKEAGLAFFFVLCAGPTFLSYRPYRFAWDDTDYLSQSITVSRVFWAGHPGRALLYTVSQRPPMMTLLGLPWRTLATWNDVGKCFVTLDVLISLFAALCLYFLLRIGVKPVLLGAASIGLLIALGPTATTGNNSLSLNATATAFLADSLFAWICLASLLLVCYEWRIPSVGTSGALFRGVLWGTLLSAGALTKINFLYFVVLILPLVFMLKLRRDGLKRALMALGAFAGTACLPTIYLLKFGAASLANARTFSFGSAAKFDPYPISMFWNDLIHFSLGVVIVHALIALALVYLFIRNRKKFWSPDLIALLVATGFAAIVLASLNRQARYAFPEVVALPFLAAVLLSGKRPPYRSAMRLAVLVFFVLACFSWPTRYRPAQDGLGEAPAVWNYAVAQHAKRLLIATDSPNLNILLLTVARKVSPMPDWGGVRELTDPIVKMTMDERFELIRNSDLVVFQDKDKLSPPYTNTRAAEYELYLLHGGYPSQRIGDDVTIYAISTNR